MYYFNFLTGDILVFSALLFYPPSLIYTTLHFDNISSGNRYCKSKGKGSYLRNHNLEKMLNNFDNIPDLNKNSFLFLPKAESERVLFFSGTFFTWCSLAIVCTYYMNFLYEGVMPNAYF